MIVFPLTINQKHCSDRGHNVCNGIDMLKNCVISLFTQPHLNVSCGKVGVVCSFSSLISQVSSQNEVI